MTDFSRGGSRRGFVRSAAALGIASIAPRQTAAADPALVGRFSPVYPWPCVGIHLSLLPSGKVLTWADDDAPLPRRRADFSKAFVVTIPPGGRPAAPVVEVDNRLTNLFCSGHAFLPDGRLLVAGGHEGTNYFGSTDTNLFEELPTYAWRLQNQSMYGGRWYCSALALGNGEILVLAGSRRGRGDFNPLPQVWETNAGGGWRSLVDAQKQQQDYPALFLAPDGRAFHCGPEDVSTFIETAGRGGRARGPRLNVGGRFYGGSVMYELGKILVAGGGYPSTATAETIDLNLPRPAWTRVASMAYSRIFCNTVVLADGRVLALNGTGSRGNNATLARLTPELWWDVTNNWLPMASAAVNRLYHSNAILLPDARVLIAGGGRPRASNGGLDNENCEIYEPPYLFQGPRPVITSATARVGYGGTLTVATPNAASITKLRLIRLPTATHNLDFGQRASTLPYVARPGVLSATIPANPNLHPPGHYMLFIVVRGVPSIAKIIRVG